jgi:hypothetical protein
LHFSKFSSFTNSKLLKLTKVRLELEQNCSLYSGLIILRSL